MGAALAFIPFLYYSARIRVDTLGGNADEMAFKGFLQFDPACRNGLSRQTLKGLCHEQRIL